MPLLPYTFVVTRDDPGLGLRAGERVILDFGNLEEPIVAVRPLGRNYGRLLNLLELGILVDLNEDQPVEPLRLAALASSRTPALTRGGRPARGRRALKLL